MSIKVPTPQSDLFEKATQRASKVWYAFFQSLGVIGNTLATLAQGKIWIGSSTGVPTQQTVSGDITLSTSGVTTLQNTATTREIAQDAIGAIIDSTLVYVDATPLLTRAALTGDITAPQASNATTLATVNSNVGSFGSATQASTITVNAKGLITAAGSVTITPAIGSITGLGTGVATALAVNVGSAGAFITYNGNAGTPSALVGTNISGTAASLTAGAATNIIPVDAAGDTTTSVLLAGSATGTQSPLTDAGLTYNATTNALTATTFVGALNGNADTATSSGSSTSATSITVTDAASDTTTWVLLAGSQTGTQGVLTDGGITYNANTDTLTVSNITGTASASTLAAAATNIIPVDAAGDTTTSVLLSGSATGSQAPLTDSGLTYNANTNALTATGGFVGDLTGNAATVTVSDAASDTTTWLMLATSQTGSLAPATDSGLSYNANTDALTATGTITVGPGSGSFTPGFYVAGSNTLAGISSSYYLPGVSIVIEGDGSYITGLAVNTSTKAGALASTSFYMEARNVADTGTPYMFGLYTYCHNDGAAVVPAAYSMYMQANANTGAGSITNNYGIYIEDQTAGTSENCAIYTGLGKIRFGDDTTIVGDTAVGGVLTESLIPPQSSVIATNTGVIVPQHFELAAGVSIELAGTAAMEIT